MAEQFNHNNPISAPVVELTGTGAGMNLFCGGVGPQIPDIDNASRRIKKTEFGACT